MSGVNPYRAPSAVVAEADGEVQPVRIFSISGRIGRARYITYTMGLTLLISTLGGLFARMLAGTNPGLLAAVTSVVWIAILVLSVMLTIQRCHDFNATGWIAILVIVPLVNLMFWFVPGTRGENRFGPPTPPNTVVTLIIAWLMPLLIVGILAAVAIPAYSDYVKRAQSQKR